MRLARAAGAEELDRAEAAGGDVPADPDLAGAAGAETPHQPITAACIAFGSYRHDGRL